MILTALLALAALPQQDVSAPESILTLRYEGIDALFVDAKDAAFLNALKMLDDRLFELPGETPEFDVPPPVLSLATRLLSGSASLSVALSSEPIEGLPIPALIDLRFGQGSEANALSLNEDLHSLLDMMGMPFDAPVAGVLSPLPAPVPAWMGASGSDFVVRLGNEAGLADPVAPELLPEGALLSSSGEMNYGLFLSEMFAFAEMTAGSDPELDAVMDMLSSMGLDNLNFEWAAGSDADRQYMVMRVADWATSLRDSGLLPEQGFGEELLRAIPADSTWVSVASMDLFGLYNFYEEMFNSMGEDFAGGVAQVEAEIGLSIHDDILAAFGDQITLYASDSTGGGGIMSTVGLIELGDREKFLALVQKVTPLLNQLAEAEANGYVRIGEEDTAHGRNITVTFPGLPVPLELVMVVTENYAVIGATPQAVAAAVQQISAPASSLLDNAGFRAQMTGPVGELVGLHWIDTPRLMVDGFGMVSLATSALANAVRSPKDPSRQPGMLLPMFSELRKDAKGILMLTFVDGTDYVTEYRSDRSQLVNAAGVAGFIYNSPILPLLGFFMAALPASMGSSSYPMASAIAIDDADRDQVERDLETIYAALEMYAMQNGGTYPESLEELTVANAEGVTYLSEGWDLLDPWDETYYYIAPYGEDDYPYVFSSTNDSAWDYGDYEYDYDYDEGMGYVEEEPKEADPVDKE